jgi:hyperosmotically inducible periplasmic protein
MKKLSILIVSVSLLISPLSVFADTGSPSSVPKGVAGAQSSLSDTAITTAVKAKLLTDSRTTGTSVKVTTSSQAVTLTGKVKSEAEKQAAQEIAANTKGVKNVTNQLEVE